MIRPDYNNSILNLITSILKYYNVESKYNSLPEIDEILKKDYNNVVLLILDGMGENILNELNENELFRKNKIKTITSVYPTTTAAAMTTYYAGKPPIETGWIAWSQYFKEFGRNINLLPWVDSYTGEKIKVPNLTRTDIIGYKNIYEQIKEKNEDVKVYEVSPDYCDQKTKISIDAKEMDEISEALEMLCKNKDKKFVLVYSDNPDGLIHKYGCKSEEVKEFLENAQNELTKLIEKIKDTNTLILISADHGHKDIEETISILDLPEIYDCLQMPPTFEGRMVGFFVKENRKQEFEEIFNEKFKDKFLLYTKEEFLNSGLLGEGIPHKKVDDFVGDYVAISTSGTRILLENYLTVATGKVDNKVSTHCGLTKEELEVPIIKIEI
jgi:hypothetical protein